MNIPCPYNVPCVDDASSFGNFSSETPDQLLFKAIHYKNMIWDGEFPLYSACLGLCTSTVSQALADLCANNNALECEAGKQFLNTAQTCSQTCADGSIATYTVPEATFMGETQAEADSMAYTFACNQVSITCTGTFPGTPPLVNIPTVPSTPASKKVPNEPQTCTTVCASGSSFTYVVPGGTVWGVNQIDANRRASGPACTMAELFPACFTTLRTEFCAWDIVDEYVQLIDPGPAPITWYLYGALPAGLDFYFSGDVATLYGVPVEGGNFTFTLYAYDANGNYTSQTFSIWVMEIATATALPDATEGAAYNQPIVVTTGTYRDPINFQLEAGSSLPDGLVLDQYTGVITGTPTTTGDYTFTIVVQDQAT